MNTAYQYARAQMLGMQFEDFRLTTAGRTYTWRVPALVRAVLVALVGLGLDSAAAFLFGRLVKVS